MAGGFQLAFAGRGPQARKMVSTSGLVSTSMICFHGQALKNSPSHQTAGKTTETTETTDEQHVSYPGLDCGSFTTSMVKNSGVKTGSSGNPTWFILPNSCWVFLIGRSFWIGLTHSSLHFGYTPKFMLGIIDSFYLESQTTSEKGYKYLFLRGHVPFSKVLWRVQLLPKGSSGKDQSIRVPVASD